MLTSALTFRVLSLGWNFWPFLGILVSMFGHWRASFKIPSFVGSLLGPCVFPRHCWSPLPPLPSLKPPLFTRSPLSFPGPLCFPLGLSVCPHPRKPWARVCILLGWIILLSSLAERVILCVRERWLWNALLRLSDFLFFTWEASDASVFHCQSVTCNAKSTSHTNQSGETSHHFTNSCISGE